MGHIVTESSPKRPGEVLRARREALDVSVREVAETLNLSMASIEAIEADQVDRLPGTVFARGYVRAYARLLELDPKPLLENYPRNEAVSAPGDRPTEPAIWEWIRRRPGLVLGGVGGAVAVVLVLAALALWPEDGAGTDAAVAGGATADAFASDPAGSGAMAARGDWSAPSARAPDAGAGRPGSGAVRGQPATRDSAAGAAPAAADGFTDTVAGQPQHAQEPALAGAGFAANEDADDGVRRITASGEDRLSFGFSDDCWVEVKSASGANLYSDLSQAGAELELVGQGPFRILLGYAPGARLTFNGEPVPLAPHTRNNVATLVLGQ